MQIPLAGRTPQIHESPWMAPGATAVGEVRMAQVGSLWFSAVIRADGDAITVGPGSKVQDGCVLHADRRVSLSLGSGVTVCHNAVLHACRIEDDVLVGMGDCALKGARGGFRLDHRGRAGDPRGQSHPRGFVHARRARKSSTVDERGRTRVDPQ